MAEYFMSIEVFSYLFTILCEVRHASIIGFLSSFNDGYRFTLFLVSYDVFIKLFSREFYVSEIYIYIRKIVILQCTQSIQS